MKGRQVALSKTKKTSIREQHQRASQKERDVCTAISVRPVYASLVLLSSLRASGQLSAPSNSLDHTRHQSLAVSGSRHRQSLAVREDGSLPKLFCPPS